MKVIALHPGSNGNCIYVETKGVRPLFDAGISGKQAESQLAAYDTHRGRLGGQLPIFVASRRDATGMLDVSG